MQFDTITIPIVQGVILKDTSRIIRVEASSNYSRIYCTDERYPITVAKVLQWFQDKLPAQDFIRTHRAHLVNRLFIEKKMGNRVLLHNGDAICISKRRMAAVRKMA